MTMHVRSVAVMAPGDMGHAVGALLRRHGVRVITCLDGRSQRTRELAFRVGIENVPDDAALVREADALLSILVPARAEELASRIARVLRAQPSDLLYVDCNAIAPQTVRQIAEVVEGAGAHFVDAGIIGPPPREGTSPRFYASGVHAGEFTQLREHGLDVRLVGDQPGQASALKMSYAALTKGTCAIMAQLCIAAKRLDVAEALSKELAFSQPHHFEWMRRWIPAMVPKAHRWVGEMEEIARTFEAVGLTPRSFEGAAETYDFVAGTSLGRISPEDWARAAMSLEEVIAEFAAARAPTSNRPAADPRFTAPAADD
jgi:3-hydroxyisobutyrate dehydrogenase-like beta-hydroxyacid dehydrogenase